MPGNAWRGVTPPNISVHPSSLSASHPSVILLLSWQQLDLFEEFIFFRIKQQIKKMFHLTVSSHTLYFPVEL